MGDLDVGTELNSNKFASLGKDDDNESLVTTGKLYKMLNGKNDKEKYKIKVRRFDLMNDIEVLEYETLLTDIVNTDTLHVSKIDRIAIQRDGSYFVIVEYVETARKKNAKRS